MGWLFGFNNKLVTEKLTKPSVLEQAAEESVELSHALLKYSRKLRNENPTPMTEEDIKQNLIEEIADVLLCIDYVCSASDIKESDILPIVVNKQLRWIKRLNKGE